MKLKLLSVALISLLSVNVMAASVEEVRAVLETEVTRIEEEKNVVCIDTEKLIALRGGLDRHTETIQYACRSSEVGSKIFYLNLTMKDKKARRPFSTGPIEDYTLSQIIIPSQRLH
jgi:hypothetical protein